MDQIRTFTDTLGFTSKQPEHISWVLNIVNCGQNILTWIKTNPWMCLCLVITCTLLFAFCGKYNVKISKKKKARINKTENFCRTTVEKLFNKPFPSIRPDWLNNQETNKNLELDMYNDTLKLAFEYNGVQHYKYNKFFHKSIEDFEKQQKRDVFKEQVCKDNGITLISIPYHIKKENIEAFIKQECKERKIPIK